MQVLMLLMIVVVVVVVVVAAALVYNCDCHCLLHEPRGSQQTPAVAAPSLQRAAGCSKCGQRQQQQQGWC